MQNRNEIVVFLKPGELFVSRERVQIKTVLGSCITVCLHDPISKIGGANHFLLPYQNDGKNTPSHYGDGAISELIELMVAGGGQKKNFCARIVGGGSLQGASSFNIGEKNIAAARELLQQEGIPIVQEDIGGQSGRKLCYHPVDDKLEVVQLASTAEKKAADQPFVELTAQQSLFLKNQFEQALKKAESSLAILVGSEVNWTTQQVVLRSMQYAQDYVMQQNDRCLITTGQKNMESPLGEVALVLPSDKVEKVVNGMLQRDPETKVAFDSLEQSAVVELANIIINAILGTLANHLDFGIFLRVPEFTQKRVNAETTPFMQPKDRWHVCMAVKANLKIPKLSMSTGVLFLIEIHSPNTLFIKMKTDMVT